MQLYSATYQLFITFGILVACAYHTGVIIRLKDLAGRIPLQIVSPLPHVRHLALDLGEL